MLRVIACVFIFNFDSHTEISTESLRSFRPLVKCYRFVKFVGINCLELLEFEEFFTLDFLQFCLKNACSTYERLKSYICFLAVVRNVHCLFYMGPVGHSKSNLETRIPYFCLKGAKYF